MIDNVVEKKKQACGNFMDWFIRLRSCMLLYEGVVCCCMRELYVVV